MELDKWQTLIGELPCWIFNKESIAVLLWGVPQKELEALEAVGSLCKGQVKADLI